uniref:Uncharacterized protein n=1 Tax=Tanacetum cinerariifolium TaxID=118510 RepID=A0A6L2NR88_TANCI|nr:hypothetical protein [Tanacetum cinerariifolium]
MNQDSYNSNSLGFDQPQPPQSLVIHQPPQELSIQEMEDLKQQYLDELKRLSNLEYRDEAYLSTHPSKCLTSFYFDDDDDEDYTSAITPDEPTLSTEEPDNSLSMGNEHLDTIPTTESDEFIKSGVETLIPIPIKENSKKGQNRIKTEQKREAWRSREKSEAVTVDRGRKTEENTNRRAVNANTCKVYSSFKERKKRNGQKVHFYESNKWRTKAAKELKM